MDLGLKGKVAVVAAASKGIGKGIAMRFAEEGASVAISARDMETLEQTAEEIRSRTGAEVLAIQADMKQLADVQRFIGTTASHFGRIDSLVCNTGGPPSGQFENISDELWEDSYQLLVMSVVRLIREALPYLKAEGGHIINIGSSSIKQPIPNLMLSNSLRLGVHGMIKTLSEELSKDRILVNTVSPGRIYTNRISSLDRINAEKLGVTVEEINQHKESLIPLGRSGNPEEFAKMAVFLASPANTYITGQMILIDGGATQAI